MAEIYRHEKALERRCELFRWVVAPQGAQSLKNAPSAIVARYERGPRHSSHVRGLYWEQLQVGHRGTQRGPGSSRGAADGMAMNLAGSLY